MRRYRIWADTYSTGILDERGRFVRQAETTIGEETWIALQRWVEDYDDIIPLPVEERERRAGEIAALDARGLRLLERVREEWPADPRTGEAHAFEYYSEGLMRTLAGDGESGA